ncbi:MAG TPA: SPFH domain-containing protein [Alphaproteobacteria bacterium]
MDLSSVFQVAALGAGAIGGIILVGSTIFTVPEKHKGLITTFGKFSREVDPGLGFKLPWPIQAVADKVPMNLQQFQDDLKTRTKDDMILTLPITVQYQVENAHQYYFNADKPEEQMAKIIAATVKDQGSSMTSEEFFTQRSQISDAVITAISEEMKDYGVAVKRVMVDQPKFPAEVEAAYASVKASEKNKLAAVNNAEAAKITTVKEAEARAEAAELYGKGIAKQRDAVVNGLHEQIKKLTEGGIHHDAAVAMVVTASQQDTLREMGHKGNLIITTGDASEQIAAFQTLRHTLKASPAPTPTPMAA